MGESKTQNYILTNNNKTKVDFMAFATAYSVDI